MRGFDRVYILRKTAARACVCNMGSQRETGNPLTFPYARGLSLILERARARARLPAAACSNRRRIINYYYITYDMPFRTYACVLSAVVDTGLNDVIMNIHPVDETTTRARIGRHQYIRAERLQADSRYQNIIYYNVQPPPIAA